MGGGAAGECVGRWSAGGEGGGVVGGVGWRCNRRGSKEMEVVVVREGLGASACFEMQTRWWWILRGPHRPRLSCHSGKAAAVQS